MENRAFRQITILVPLLVLAHLLGVGRVQAQTCPRSNVLLLLDVSASMNATKRAEASDAIKAMVTEFQVNISAVQFGLMTFCGDLANKAGVYTPLKIKREVPFSATSATKILQYLPLTQAHVCYGTPMCAGAKGAYDYFSTQVLTKAAHQTRANYVILITDGYPTDKKTCGDAETYIKKLLNVAVGGKTYKIKTFVIGFGSGSNPTILQQYASAGATIKYYLAQYQGSLATVLRSVLGSLGSEVCDDQDNDCDGQIDEDWADKGKICRLGKGACRTAGKWVCKPDKSGLTCDAVPGAPSPEICDNQDNDCDGSVDENVVRPCQSKCGKGTELCIAGAWKNCSAPIPSKEVCDGKDNDCDGIADNGLTRPCKSACGDGEETCIAGRWESCSAPTPSKEVCDGKDNDCNGSIDDGILPRACQGACGTGTATCTTGKWSGCQGKPPEPEICDGKDNDCDGQIDNDITRPCKTSCGSGSETCIQGSWENCSAKLPSPETCDGIDNNCNGKIDDGATCPSGECIQGACVQPCRNGECPTRFDCVDGFCFERKCQPDCPQGELCVMGVCQPPGCRPACEDGLLCKDNQCVSDPCRDISCRVGEYCQAGKCIPPCEKGLCEADQLCVDGVCQEDPCKDLSCKQDERCEKGACVPEPCAGKTCPDGLSCVKGSCETPLCARVKCPAGTTCEADGQCWLPPREQGHTDVLLTNEPDPLQDAATQDLPPQDSSSSGHNNDTKTPEGSIPSACGCENTSPLSLPPLLLLLLLLLSPKTHRAE